MISKVAAKMWDDLFVIDWIILIPFVITIVSLMWIHNSRKDFRKDLKENLKKMPNNPDWAEKQRKSLNGAYSLFTNCITLYPLFGMLGTVFSLISVGDVDFSQASESLAAIKGDFFTALTSTAWGIVFAAFFKIWNAFLQPGIEDDMNILTSLVDDLKEKNGTKYTL